MRGLTSPNFALRTFFISFELTTTKISDVSLPTKHIPSVTTTSRKRQRFQPQLFKIKETKDLKNTEL